MEPGPVPTALSRRIAFIEGIRGLTASYVVLFHIVHGFLPAPTSLLGKLWWRFTAFGHDAVSVFIVVSGFCLTLTLRKQSQHGKFTLALDLPRFAFRRARRILPPYFAALLLSLGLIALVPPLRSSDTGTIWDSSHPALTVDAIGSHLLLVHNWFPELKFRINGPLWSVATEWHIYFLFACVLWPIRSRFGPLGLLLSSLVLGFGPLFFAPLFSASAAVWYVPLFAFGMIACLGTTLGVAPERDALESPDLARRALVVTGVVVAMGLGGARLWFRFQPIADSLVGFSTALMLAALATPQRGSSAMSTLVERLRQALEIDLLQRLGRASYSIYLTHLPLVALVAFAIPEGGAFRGLLVLGTGLIVSYAFGAVFYFLVERPFLSQRSK